MKRKPGPRPINISVRFWRLVEIRDIWECWYFTGSILPNGYGTFEQRQAHRCAYKLFYGHMNNELDVLHSCDNPPCCNPFHLWQGTQQDNANDMVRKGRSNYGERHWNHKLLSSDVEYIRTSSESSRLLSEKFGVTQRTINRIRQGERWKGPDDKPLKHSEKLFAVVR